MIKQTLAALAMTMGVAQAMDGFTAHNYGPVYLADGTEKQLNCVYSHTIEGSWLVSDQTSSSHVTLIGQDCPADQAAAITSINSFGAALSWPPLVAEVDDVAEWGPWSTQMDSNGRLYRTCNVTIKGVEDSPAKTCDGYSNGYQDAHQLQTVFITRDNNDGTVRKYTCGDHTHSGSLVSVNVGTIVSGSGSQHYWSSAGSIPNSCSKAEIRRVTRDSTSETLLDYEYTNDTNITLLDTAVEGERELVATTSGIKTTYTERAGTCTVTVNNNRDAVAAACPTVDETAVVGTVYEYEGDYKWGPQTYPTGLMCFKGKVLNDLGETILRRTSRFHAQPFTNPQVIVTNGSECPTEANVPGFDPGRGFTFEVATDTAAWTWDGATVASEIDGLTFNTTETQVCAVTVVGMEDDNPPTCSGSPITRVTSGVTADTHERSGRFDYYYTAQWTLDTNHRGRQYLLGTFQFRDQQQTSYVKFRPWKTSDRYLFHINGRYGTGSTLEAALRQGFERVGVADRYMQDYLDQYEVIQ